MTETKLPTSTRHDSPRVRSALAGQVPLRPDVPTPGRRSSLIRQRRATDAAASALAGPDRLSTGASSVILVALVATVVVQTFWPHMAPLATGLTVGLSGILIGRGHQRAHAELHAELSSVKDRLADLDLQNVELERFAGRVAHDIKASVSVVAASLATLDSITDAAGRRRLEAIALRGAHRTATTVDALLQHAKSMSHPVVRSRIVVPDLVAAGIEALSGELDLVNAEVADETGSAVLWGDPVLLAQVVQNLVANAVKYRRGDAAPEVRITARDEPGATVLVVADAGVGIPANRRDEVFEHGLQIDGDVDGAGLGLSTCLTIVQRHGGQMRVVDSDLGGVAVEVVLPRR